VVAGIAREGARDRPALEPRAQEAPAAAVEQTRHAGRSLQPAERARLAAREERRDRPQPERAGTEVAAHGRDRLRAALDDAKLDAAEEIGLQHLLRLEGVGAAGELAPAAGVLALARPAQQLDAGERAREVRRDRRGTECEQCERSREQQRRADELPR